MSFHQQRMETILHHVHVRPRLHSHDDIVEKALPEDPRSRRCVREPDGVIHIVSPLVQAFAAQYTNDQERRAADEHILAHRIHVLGEEVLDHGLAEYNDLGIAFHVFRREEDAGLRRPIVHLRKVLAGSNGSDDQVLIAQAKKRRHICFRNCHGDARHAADRWQIFRQKTGHDIG